ncbi:hypothetical protein HYFRA_00008709 [Hymenoscyphus fraxineus]|uniref:Carrier domain-containing protein n=1 Tax=Hymenoscyphus fraxineus TaxID=746836 RepID=A0A9N9L190_9HELO|nr:hypothetical protein HYFRA_00008709 [Hymenoscyphus fraxineus]
MSDSLSILNDPPKRIDGPGLLHQMIQWDDYNTAHAIDFTTNGHRRQYTYDEVQICVRVLASRIHEALSLTIRPVTNQIHSQRQHIVPVLLPQCPGLYISQLAILESGGAFCPITLDSPTERIRFVVSDVAASLVITTSEFKDAVSWDGGPMVLLIDQFPTIQSIQPSCSGYRLAHSEDLAYVMYTSGSSGQPKGVAVSHLAVTQSLLAHQRHIPQFRRFLQFAAPSFDVSVFEIFFPLVRGCTLVGCDRNYLLNDLPGTINDLDVDAAELTPTVVGSLLQNRSNVPNLKLLLTIGEMLTWPIVHEFGGSEAKSAMLYGMYGPTEAAIHCTIYPAMNDDTPPGNIGIPFDTVSTFIAAPGDSNDTENDLRLLAIGEIGELVLGGPQLARGYLNREEENQLAFIQAHGTTYYRTGDKARQLHDGTIEILGRMSAGQVKLRGQRIELGEVEQAIYKHPGLKSVVAFVTNSTLVVFALVASQTVDPADIQHTCAKWLPKFMVPGEIVILQEFPYLPSGKVDKKRLETDYQQRANDGHGDSAYLTATERVVHNILQDLLDPFAPDRRLAGVGLDSLVAIRVSSKLRELNFNITAVSVLHAETLSELAQACDESVSATTPTPTLNRKNNMNMDTSELIAVLNGHAGGVESVMPCTPLQSAMLAETAADSKAYRNWIELAFSGQPSFETLSSVINRLAELNPVLRTGFAESSTFEGFAQIVWSSLQGQQVELVQELTYGPVPIERTSLHHPIHFQILNTADNSKLLIHIHHALYDAWSLELLLDDFDCLLRGQSSKTRPSFASVVQGYADGTFNTDQWISKQYWKDHIDGLDLRVLPNFHSQKSELNGLAIRKYDSSIPTTVVESAAKYLNCSSQSIFQAAYAIILSSYHGSSDICFGTVFSGRTLPIPGIEEIVGPCLATLPIRVDTSLFLDFHTLIKDINSINRKHLEHSTVPLREIKSSVEVQPQQYLFDTLMIWQQTLHSFDHGRKFVTLIDTMDNLEFNLTLEVIPGKGNVVLKANYRQSVFPELQIDLLLRQLEGIVMLAIKDHKSAPLESIFDGLEHDIMSIENPNPLTDQKPETLSSPVERIALQDPTRIAIEFATDINSQNLESTSITYFDLNIRANQMAHHLLSLKALPDELVCICMEKCIDLYTSILSTAKIGAGYLPLTPDVPEERLRRILKESKTRVAVTHSSLRPLFKLFRDIEVVYIDEVNFSGYPNNNPCYLSRPEHVSYCVFTSGSTGIPKGVLVTQGNLLSNLDVLEELYPSNEHSRFLQSCSQAFDVSVFEIFFTWRIGGCICSAIKDVIFRDIEQAIRSLDVTHLSLTPTVAALVDPKNVPNVEFLVTAGEAVTQKVFNTWADRGLFQGYGPSETTNICTVNPRVTHNDSINNIGRPFKNTSAFVLSRHGEFSVVPKGGEGELCFGGSQVFRGYINESQQVGKIIEHPQFGRLYRSGDFGRLMCDGTLAFTGRKDDQVKIRGQRVELGEINNVMLRSKEVHDCVTIVIEIGGNSQLVCFWTTSVDATGALICLQPDQEITSLLFKHLESSLPTYMIPSALIPISDLPSTSQGKIDKRLLVNEYEALDIKYLEKASRTETSSSNHEWTALEKEIAQAVSQVTKMEINQIQLDTSFFTLGIDSISAILLSRTLNSSISRQVEISQILKNPSVVRLAGMLHHEVPAVSSIEAINFDFGLDHKFVNATIETFKKMGKIVQSIVPCTPLQEAMLSASESTSKSLYSNEVILDVHGDIARIRKCWQEMVQRHEILRTSFVATDDPRYAYAQVVLKEHILDIKNVNENKDYGNSSSLVSERLSEDRKFEPPYSIEVQASATYTRLRITMHHALYDAVALAILYEEVELFYHDETLSMPVPFSPFLQLMSSMDMEAADQFWGNVLKGHHPKLFPLSVGSIKSQQPAQTSPQIQTLSSEISLCWLEGCVKENSTSLLAVCQTTWSGLLSEYLQEKDVCFGSIVSGRTVAIEGIERLVAPCFNTIPVRLQDIHKLSYLEAFRKLQALSIESLPFQLTPLRRNQSKFSPNGSRLFDTLFILQQPPRELDPSIWSLSEDRGAMDFPVVIEVVPRRKDDTLEITLHSFSSVLSSTDAISILESFEKRLEESLKTPRKQILSPDIKEKILASSATRTAKTSSEAQPMSAQVMSANEEMIRDALADFTDVPRSRIPRDVSIFRLGLDSISAVQVATRLRKLGHNMMASDILEHPSIADLAAHLENRENKPLSEKFYDFELFDKTHREGIIASNDLRADIIESIRPCTVVQQGMIAQSLHSQGEEYVNSMWMELEPTVSVSRLRDAWSETCKSNEILRTGFVSTDDPQNPFAMVTYSDDTLQLPFYDGENPVQLLIKDLKRPWSLSIREEGGKNTMRLTAHHALYDGQSLQMILEDVAKAYTSGSTDGRPPISSLLGAILSTAGEYIEAQKEFWLMEENTVVINKFPELTPLQVASNRSSVREIISRSSLARLENGCRDNGVTMQAACQAAWARLLAAYTGESSTTFGMVLSGRSVCEEAERTSFPSMVTLPVRCNIVGTNTELLQRTMTHNAKLQNYQFSPLTSIQKWAGYPEGKIFDTLFAYQKLPESEDPIVMPWKLVREEAAADYAVSLEVQPMGSDVLIVRLTFREDIIPIEHSDILLRQYDSILLDILENPGNACDVALKFGPELLSITPAREHELPSEIMLLHQFVERGARQWPNKKAFEFAASLDPGNTKIQSWTYAELEEEGNKIAQFLVDRGVQSGELIAISFDKCPEASFAIIGILKAGCAYVALDPNAPIERVQFILADSAARLVLASGKPGQALKGNVDKEIILLDSNEVWSSYSSEPPELSRETLPQDVSYCLYTSGTTGTPKGCLITHENAVQAMLSFSRLFADHWTEDSKWLQFASFHFDVSVLEQFWSWSVGICVSSAPRDVIFEDIPGTIQRFGITHIDLTPSLARLLHPEDVPSLCKGVFITGGEQLRQEILDVWGEHSCIYNGYGPTEATIGVTMYPRVPRNGKPSNIGPAFDNVGSFVLKPGTEIPVLRGGVGELCVSGKLVGKGYLNRPDLTTERFPTLKDFGERVYRTGDLVRILHDGSFIFLGRADDQVKLRGQRLELMEINEVVKKAVEGLQDVVTLVLKYSTQQKEQLITFFVPATQTESQTRGALIQQMRHACKARLPGYMIPTRFIPIEKLPLNANNKADSKQLAKFYNDLSVDELQALSRSDQKDLDWNQKENTAVALIAEAMRIEDISAITRSSNIFELGLDSISIIGFSRALHKSGLQNAKVSVIRNNPNMGALVAVLSSDAYLENGTENEYIAAIQKIAAFEQKHVATVCLELGIEATEVECVMPCTPVQEGMIYRFLESDFPLYFNGFSFRIEEGIDFERLLGAWKRVVDKVQVLRTKFVPTDDGFAQVVFKSVGVSWSEAPIDYSAMEKLTALRSPYTLRTEKNSQGVVMKIQIFHGLYDGISLTKLLQKVVEEFKGSTSVDYGPSFQSSLPYGPLSRVDGAQKFWVDHLKDWSYKPIPAILDSQKDVIATLKLTNLSGLEQFRKSLAVTPQALVQAAWLSVLQTISSTRITLGLVISGRSIDFEDAENVIGPLFNTVPIHCDISTSQNFKDLILRCHETNMRMQNFTHTPLKDIQKWSGAKTRQPLFESLFVFQREREEEINFADGVWREEEDKLVADYKIAFEATMGIDGESLGLIIVAKGDVITMDAGNELLRMMEKTLLDVIANEGNMSIPGNKASMTELAPDVEGRVGSSSNGASKQDFSDEVFEWTDDTRSIRKEISELAQVLELSVHHTSSIFELGLDSIDVIKLSSRLKKKGIEMPVSAIIKAQSISEMALNLSSKTNQGSKESSAKLLEDMSQALSKSLKESGRLPEELELILPATPLQQSMVNEMVRSDYKRYLNIDALELRSNIDFERLVSAVNMAVDNSPIFRATFVQVEDPSLSVSYAQIIPSVQHKWSACYKHTLLPEESFDDFMGDLSSKCISFARDRGELFQLHFIDTDAAQYFVMVAAHALYDGTSMRLFHEDIVKAYHKRLEPRMDFTPFLGEVVRSTTEEAKKFWRSTLSGLPVAVFPKKQVSEEEGSKIYRLEKTSHVSLKDVEELCRSSRVTLQTVGQTAWSLVLAQLMGQLDVVFGSVLTCRDTEEANQVIFPLMNTVAVRSVIHGTLGEMLSYMQNISDTTRQYQHFSLGTAQAYALSSRQPGDSKDTTIFDTLFIYQGRRSTVQEENLYDSVYGVSDVEFPVCVEMEVVDGKIVWTTACKAVARTEKETSVLLDSLDLVLQKLIENTEVPTITSDSEGISVCGLQKFEVARSQPRIAAVPAQKISEEWSEVELKIRKALHEVSDISEESIRKDLTIFHLGLDSILVLKLPALFRRMEIKLSVSDVLREQTIDAMAKLIASAEPKVEKVIDVEGILKRAVDEIGGEEELNVLSQEIGEIAYVMPATAGQLYMIRRWQASRGGLFNPTFTYKISAGFNKEQLENAWKGLLSRHDILRTKFLEVNDKILQVIFKEPKNEIKYETEIKNGAMVLKLKIHHALYDGTSLPILLKDLQSLYLSKHLTPMDQGFRSFVAQSLTASQTAKQKWNQYLSDAPPPAPLPKLVNINRRTEIYHPNLPLSNLGAQARSLGVTIDTLLLASIARTYAQHLGTKDVVYGIYLANRAAFGEDLSTVVAPTLNFIPLVVRAAKEKRLEDIAREIQSDLGMFHEQEMGCVSLEEVGRSVGLLVNILKDDKGEVHENQTGAFESADCLGESSGVVEGVEDERFAGLDIQGSGVYQPTIDVELRYRPGGTIDFGIFAPVEMLDVETGEAFVDTFKGAFLG